MKSQPDITLFTRWLSGGGAERVMLNLAQGFAARGLRVDLVIIQSRDEWHENYHPNLRIVDLEIQEASRFKYFPSSLQSIRALPKLVSYLRRHRPPVLMSATHFINEIALLAKQFARVPTRIVVTEHTFLSREVKLTEQMSSRLVPLTVRSLYSSADRIIAVSRGVAEDLTNFMSTPSAKIQVIYNPVVTPDIHQAASQAVDHPWFRHKDVPVIVGGGRFVRQKDFPTLLRAFAHLRKRREARLVLVGDGRERLALTQLAQTLGIDQDFWMSGFTENPYGYLQKADVFVLSSAWEGLPTILIEALALGTPIVSTDCPSGPAEILQHGDYGHLVAVGDDQAMAASIEAVLAGQHPSVPPAWMQQFTPDAVIQKYMETLKLSSDEGDFGSTENAQPPPENADWSSPATPHQKSESKGVSIVIPAHNAARPIGEALATIKSQTYPT